MDVAFGQARIGDADEVHAFAHVVDGLHAGVAHCGAQPSDHLVQDRSGRALIGNLAFDAFRDKLVAFADLFLEVTICRAARHCADRAHAAIAFVGASLEQEDFARCFVCACQHRTNHCAVCTCRDGLGQIARELNAAIGDDRIVGFRGFLGAIHYSGQLRNADPGNDARRADRPRSDANFHGIRTCIDQGAGGLSGGDIARHHLHGIRIFLNTFNSLCDRYRMTVGCVDHDQIDARVDQCLRAFQPGIAYRRRRSNSQAAKFVLAGVRVQDRLLDVLDSQKPRAFALVIDDQQFLDAPFLQQLACRLQIYRLTHSRQIVRCHQCADRSLFIFGKANVTAGQDARQTLVVIDNGEAGDFVLLLQCHCIGQGLVWQKRDRIINDSTFETLNAFDLLSLHVDVEIAVDHAHAAPLRHADRHFGFGHGIHRRAEQRDVQADAFCNPRAGVRIGRQNLGRAGYHQDIIECERLTNLHQILRQRVRCWRVAISCWRTKGKADRRGRDRMRTSSATGDIRMRHILGIVLSLMMPLSAWSQQVDLANVVAIADGDLNDDGSRDRAALVSRDGDLDLYVFLSADAPGERVLAGKADAIGFAGRAWGTEPELGITERGAIRLVSKNEAIGRGRWRETLTILYRDGRVVVGGYTYTSRDTLDLDYRYDCDVNLFNGKGFFNDTAIRTDRRATPIETFERDGICPEG